MFAHELLDGIGAGAEPELWKARNQAGAATAPSGRDGLETW
jgi:hypothetical protein